MSKQRINRIQQVLSQRQPDLTVIMDGVHKPHNIAAIVRSCDAVGVMDVHLACPRDKRLRAGATPHATSGGSQKWIAQHHYENASVAIQHVQAKGFQVLAANKSDKAKNFRLCDFTRPTALLMGAELFGVDKTSLAQVDGEIFIPMMGMVESFNVSVACAILLAEVQRQRLIARHYDQPKLSSAEITRMSFEWSYPKLSKLYQKQGKAYPALDDDGDIVTDFNESNVVLP